MSEPFPSDRITGPDYISVSDARNAIMKAREEGRLEGLEEAEAEAAVRSLPYSSKTISGMNPALAAIRALKEKQPTD